MNVHDKPWAFHSMIYKQSEGFIISLRLPFMTITTSRNDNAYFRRMIWFLLNIFYCYIVYASYNSAVTVVILLKFEHNNIYDLFWTRAIAYKIKQPVKFSFAYCCNNIIKVKSSYFEVKSKRYTIDYVIHHWKINNIDFLFKKIDHITPLIIGTCRDHSF